MLSNKELEFLKRWEQVRENESRFVSKLIKGLPMACMFGLPILFSVAMVYFFSPEFFTRISSMVSGSSGVIIISVFIFIIFFSYFRMHFKWEMNEQLYMELKSRDEKLHAAENQLLNS